MSKYCCRHAAKIDTLGINAVGEGDEDRDRNNIGGVEDRRDPAASLLVSDQSVVNSGSNAGQKNTPIWTSTWAAQTSTTRCVADTRSLVIAVRCLGCR